MSQHVKEEAQCYQKLRRPAVVGKLKIELCINYIIFAEKILITLQKLNCPLPALYCKFC